MSDAFVVSYIVLWILTAIGLVIGFGSARQVALITRRLPSEVVKESGPQLGTIVSEFSAMTLDGREVTIGRPERKTILMFLEDGCSTCDAVLPKFRELVDELPDTEMWLLFEREPSEKNVVRDGLVRRVLVSEKAFRRWHIRTVPFACVLDSEGTLEAKGQMIGEVERLRQTLGLDPTPVETAENGEVEADELVRQAP
jgi:methylamine dehydrogenase accessory protein MauD